MVSAVWAGVVVEDLERAKAWFEAVFERSPDDAPMGGLYEWHLDGHVLQLVALAKVRETQKMPAWGAAGCSSVTIVVDDAESSARRACDAGGRRVSAFENPAFRTVSVSDLEGNLVTFLQTTSG